MRVIECEQGTPDWHNARLGVLTASRCKALVTAGGKVSKGKGVMSLQYELAAEALIGEPVRDISNAAMERGTALESEARAWLAMEIDADIAEVGFIVSDDGRVGCSPDGILEDGRGVELKCPLAHTQVRYADDDAALYEAYQHQIQLGFYVTGWSEWILASYSPSLRIPNVVRVEKPDPQYQDALKAAIPPFLKGVDRILAEIRERCPIDNPFM